MSFDYFYGQQSDLFTFYRVPKVLFTNERFWNISADAKMLYGILLDRMSLSAKNGWIDKNGRVYIIFTIDEAKMALNCAEQKAIKLLSELEKKAGLIERKRQGLGKPNLIYVKNFISAVDSQLLNCENHNSGTMEITTQELPKSQCNNTDIKNTEFILSLVEIFTLIHYNIIRKFVRKQIDKSELTCNSRRERKYKCNISSIYNTWFRVIQTIIFQAVLFRNRTKNSSLLN